MVKLRGPMFSLGASGTLADAVTFAIWKGRPYARERVIPSNPKSGAQTGRRAMLRFLSQAWAALTTGEKATWQDLADELVASPFNAYISYNMRRWHNFMSPAQETPAGEANNGSDNVLTAAVWEENRIKMSLAGTALAEAWGITFHASLTGTYDPSVGNCILIELDTTIAAHDVFWTPPSVATWYLDTIAFSDDGVKETEGGEQSAAPP